MTGKTKLSITFHGGVGSVTGANFLLADDGPQEKKILIDCGFFQGSRVAEKKNREPFPYDPKEIDTLIITHAHLDHIGRIPKLVHDGFRGPIYSTPPTRDITELSLTDSLGVLTKEAKGSKEPIIYNKVDVERSMKQWKTVDYHQEFELGDWQVSLLDAGHILGSAMIRFVHQPSGKVFVFTGDLGNSPSLLLRDTEVVADADYLVMESVYGDRNHENHEVALAKLEDVIEDTVNAQGTLMVPAFSIERTQELLHEIEKMVEGSRIPVVPVFLDSPLAIKVTDIYSRYLDYLNKEVNELINKGNAIFRFPQLHRTLKTSESKAIAGIEGPKIIIAGSGMSNGGRIIHHEKRFLADPKSALLLVGYQAAGSLGRQLEDGAKWVKILGEDVPVRARTVVISGYSAHKGSDDLFGFVSHSADKVKKVFVTMGEPHSSLFLVQRLRDYLGIDATMPEPGQQFEVEV
ncbi:MAG: MBL fold metallo-hydrolase [Patescibacteria group bacterium]|nr:MBL fold metallo-hydrolase [Patescibacteria group bacterium]